MGRHVVTDQVWSSEYDIPCAVQSYFRAPQNNIFVPNSHGDRIRRTKRTMMQASGSIHRARFAMSQKLFDETDVSLTLAVWVICVQPTDIHNIRTGVVLEEAVWRQVRKIAHREKFYSFSTMKHTLRKQEIDQSARITPW
jgi:hypothetical protein